MISFNDEAELQRKIASILQKQGFTFVITPHDFDLVDRVRQIFIEVKKEIFNPSQILYALAKNNEKRVRFIGLATGFEIRLYKPPPFDEIVAFAKSCDVKMMKSPSSIGNPQRNEKAFELLGKHHIIWDYRGKLNVDERRQEIFLDESNLVYFRDLFAKYKINPVKFITYVVDVFGKNQKLVVNNEGRIININTFVPYKNFEEKIVEKTFNIKDIVDPSYFDYTSIMNHHDRSLFESIGIKPDEVTDLLHKIDSLESISIRHKMGRFFTKRSVVDKVVEIVRDINPDYIVEPFVGAGSLIEGLVGRFKGCGNDINTDHINVLKKKYEGSGWKFTNLDMFTTPTETLFKEFGIVKGSNLMLLTNPPFGTSNANKLASKKEEIVGVSRKTQIQYGELGEKYGRGDMILPAIGRMIEIIKRNGVGYLITFSPAGIYCGRKRFNKVLKALLKDFEYISGCMTTGTSGYFMFAVWKLKENVNIEVENISFFFEEKEYKLKKMLLLTEHWNNDTRRIINDEIAVQNCGVFNAPTPKMFHHMVEKGGSELVPENVKIGLNLKNVPSELFYGLWSVTVGRRALVEAPPYINDAYVHLPDIKRKETFEILTYAMIHVLIQELRFKRTLGKIGFVGMSKIFKFGGETLTKGANHLIEKYGYCPFMNRTLKDLFEELKNIKDVETLKKGYIQPIAKEIEKRLNIIGYWDFIPIPKSL